MFESTGEMIIALILLVVTVFPFVYLPLRGRKAKQTPDLPREAVLDNANPEGTSGGKRKRGGNGSARACLPRTVDSVACGGKNPPVQRQ